MLDFFGQIMKLPAEALIYGMDMFFQGIGTLVESPLHTPHMMQTHMDSYAIVSGGHENGYGTAYQETSEKDWNVADKDLSGELLKLVRHKVIFVKRDLEHVFADKEELVAGSIDEAGFTAWKIAEFIQALDETPIPEKWRRKSYPRPSSPGDTINSLDEEDKKHLRVYFEVLDRYERQSPNYEAQKISVLEQIRDKMPSPGTP